jgi:hypothetical protein
MCQVCEDVDRELPQVTCEQIKLASSGKAELAAIELLPGTEEDAEAVVADEAPESAL